VNDSKDTTLSINTMVKDYNKEGVVPVPGTLAPEGDHADVAPGQVKVYPMFWKMGHDCNCQISWTHTSTKS